MPINWRLAAAELRFILDHSEARALVCDDALRRPRERGDARSRARPRARVHLGRAITRAGSASPICAIAPARPARAAGRGRRHPPADVHVGTTGRPKGVMLTHANLAWKNYAHITEFGFTSADVGLACGPLYHVGALDLVTTTMIAVGATTIIHRVFDAARVVDEIERSRVTVRVDCARDGPGDPRGPRDRGARPLVGPRAHRGRREDADPVHRAPAAGRSRRRGSRTRTD